MPSLARTTLYNAFGSAAMLGSGFFTTLIAARVLGPEAVGLVSFATLIVTFALALLDLGLPGAMMRFMPELRAKGGGNERSVAALVLVPYAGLTIAAALLLFAGLRVSRLDLGPSPTLMAALIAACAAVQSLAAFHYGVLKGQQSFGRFAALACLSGTAQVGLALAGAVTYGVPGVLAATLAAYCIPAAAALARLRFAAMVPGLDLLRRLVTYSSHTWAIYVFTTISWSRLEVYFLREAWGDHAAGVFSAGLNLANLALQGPMFLTGALLPYLAAKHVSDPNSVAPAFRKALIGFSIVVIPITFGAATLCPLLMPWIYGARFSDGIPAATILVAANASMAVIAIVQQFAFASERTFPLLIWSAATAALTVLSGFTLIEWFGLAGAAAGRAILLAASATVLLALAHRWRWPVPWLALLGIISASACGALASATVIGR